MLIFDRSRARIRVNNKRSPFEVIPPPLIFNVRLAMDWGLVESVSKYEKSIDE